ncbi:hypothetical protein DPMN_162987 [Dreissena polymorpha]|uniref:Uncharacterized protein n=1 Tax=Dreissena polymorpha TaxID=45954 RepID=A0A9D4ERB4_DREPO|nr:hypothetical protein DPMN_162987 [Dreissena polymorpha]
MAARAVFLATILSSLFLCALAVSPGMFEKVDPYCMERAPLLAGVCEAPRFIWTFDPDNRECVRTMGCFPDGGPEYNIFPGLVGCERWCSMTYEK